jgi:hypothetical protein
MTSSTIIAVMSREIPDFWVGTPKGKTELWTPFVPYLDKNSSVWTESSRGDRGWGAVGRLKSGVTIQQANADLEKDRQQSRRAISGRSRRWRATAAFAGRPGQQFASCAAQRLFSSFSLLAPMSLSAFGKKFGSRTRNCFEKGLGSRNLESHSAIRNRKFGFGITGWSDLLRCCVVGLRDCGPGSSRAVAATVVGGCRFPRPRLWFLRVDIQQRSFRDDTGVG